MPTVPLRKKFRFRINDREHEVQLNKIMDDKAQITVNGRAVEVELIPEQRTDLTPRLVLSQSVQTPVSRQPVTSRPGDSSDIYVVASPMPGSILKISVQAGDIIEAGQTLLVMEAMKMENDVKAPVSGKVKAIEAKEGANVLEGDVLIRLEPADKS